MLERPFGASRSLSHGSVSFYLRGWLVERQEQKQNQVAQVAAADPFVSGLVGSAVHRQRQELQAPPARANPELLRSHGAAQRPGPAAIPADRTRAAAAEARMVGLKQLLERADLSGDALMAKKGGMLALGQCSASLGKWRECWYAASR